MAPSSRARLSRARQRNCGRRGDALRLLLRVLRKGRPLTERELAPLMDSARDRARRGVPLDDILHAYRIGTMVAWEAVVREARRQSGGPDAALELVGELMRFVDHVSTAVARTYLDEQSRLTIDEEQRHGRLLAMLLDGDLDGASRLAEQSGLALAEEYVVVLLRVDEPGHRGATRADDLRQRLASRSVVVARRDRAVLMLWPSAVTLADITATLGPPAPAGPEPLVAYARGPVGEPRILPCRGGARAGSAGGPRRCLRLGGRTA